MSIAELPARKPPTRKYGDRIVDSEWAGKQVERIANAVYDRRVAVEQKLSKARHELAEEPDSVSLSAIVGCCDEEHRFLEGLTTIYESAMNTIGDCAFNKGEEPKPPVESPAG